MTTAASSAVPNPWLGRRVIAWGHQGGDEGHTPNTIPALRAALAGGAHALEFDLHLTADHQLVLHHDATIQGPDGSETKIADKTLADLRVDHPDLATLDEVLSTFPRVPLTVEIKAAAAARVAAQALAAEDAPRAVIVTAFSDSTVKEIKRAEPALDTAPGMFTMIRFWVLAGLRLQRFAASLGDQHVALQSPLRFEEVKYAKCVPLLKRAHVTTRHFVTAAHQIGLAVHVWTVDEKPEIVDAITMGVDGIMTNRPTTLAAVLADKGVSWKGS